MIHKVISLALLLSLFAAGCSEKSSLLIPGEEASQSVSEQPKDLVGINSLYISQPVQEQAVQIQGDASQESLSKILFDAAHAELTMEIKKDESKSPSTNPIGDAQSAGADSVLLTTVQRYSEREGSAIGADKAAAASFAMKIVRLSDKKVVWSSSYTFSDVPLNENLFAYQNSVANKGGSAGWGTAARAVENGFRQGLRDFNDLRTTQFTSRR